MTWDGRDNVVGDLNFVEVDDFRAEVSGLGLGNVRGADHLVGEHQIHQANPGGLSFGTHLGHLVRGDEAEIHEDVDQIIVFFSHSSLRTQHVHRGNAVKQSTGPTVDVNADQTTC